MRTRSRTKVLVKPYQINLKSGQLLRGTTTSRGVQATVEEAVGRNFSAYGGTPPLTSSYQTFVSLTVPTGGGAFNVIVNASVSAYETTSETLDVQLLKDASQLDIVSSTGTSMFCNLTYGPVESTFMGGEVLTLQVRVTGNTTGGGAGNIQLQEIL